MRVICASPWVPREWITAHGFGWKGVWASVCRQPVVIPEGACAYAQAMAAFGPADEAACLVLGGTCDQIRRAADELIAKAKLPVFLFNVPATWQTPAARQLYRGELDRLGRFLARLGGRSPGPSELAQAVEKENAARNALRELLNGLPARKGAEALLQYFAEGTQPRRTEAAPARAGVPVAIAGGPLLPHHWELFSLIEAARGCVVVNATEPGERCLLPPLAVPAVGGISPETLADHYFEHIIDVFRRPNSQLYEWLGARMAAAGVRGIVVWTQVGCDLWRAEAASLKEAFGVPVLAIDAQAFAAAGSRETTRLHAFVEALR